MVERRFRSMSQLRVAIVGLGQAARNIHLPALAATTELFELVAAFDPDESARTAFEKSHAGVPWAESLEELLAGSPDVVLLASPPAFHESQTLAALEAGCHVFCEKPMAEDLEQADRMLGAAERTGRRLLINSEFPDLAIHRAARDQVGSEEFGRLLFLRVTQNFRVTDATESGWRASTERRVAFDFGLRPVRWAAGATRLPHAAADAGWQGNARPHPPGV